MRDVHTCCVCMDVCFVLFLVCLSTCVCEYLQVQGPLRECLRAGRFRASPLLHPTCVRSCCNWRASCVATKQKTKIPQCCNCSFTPMPLIPVYLYSNSYMHIFSYRLILMAGLTSNLYWNCSLILKFHRLIWQGTNKISTKKRKSKSVY